VDRGESRKGPKGRDCRGCPKAVLGRAGSCRTLRIPNIISTLTRCERYVEIFISAFSSNCNHSASRNRQLFVVLVGETVL